jgi:Tol biopolymer transport system component
MDRDGGNPTQMTQGQFEFEALPTPDGKWLGFIGGSDQRLYRMSLEGGEPVPLTEQRVNNPSLSPDGTRIAYRALDSERRQVMTFVIPLEGGEPVAVLDLPGGAYGWTPDGSGITYSDDTDGVENLWIQPLDGGPPRQVTHLDTDEIADFAWSPDGAQLILARGKTVSDVVLLRDFR